MKALHRYLVLFALVLAVILILLVTITAPLIYSLEKDTFPSRFHNNTDALKRQSLNSTSDILPLMQELSGYSGPIILNVRLGDPEQARRDLEMFTKNRKTFDNLVVKLDMTESEMKEYSKNRALQNQLLSELVNSSVSLEELKKLEVQYRNADNPTMLMSVQMEGDALHERIQELYDRYENITASTIATGKKVGIDTAQEETSVGNFRLYVEETSSVTRFSYEAPPRRTNLLTFVLLPEQVRYGETVSYSGFLLSPAGLRYTGIPEKKVTLYLDNEPVSVTGTSSDGGYSVQVPVERITAGTHPVYAESGTILSEKRTLTVGWTDSVTTLSKPVTARGNVTVSGSVTAGVPVRNAPVDIFSDGNAVLRTTTDAKGQFRSFVNLPPGTHLLVARFTGTGFPLRPSESEPQEIRISPNLLPEDYSGLVVVTAVAVTLALFLGGAFWYLRRMRGGRTSFGLVKEITGIKRTDAFGEEVPEAPAQEEFSANKASGEDATGIHEPLFNRYSRTLQEHGISEAAFGVYRDLSRRIARDQQIKGYMCMTPGELSRSCRNKSYCSSFSRFVSIYETVRYGGLGTGAVRAEFENVLQHTDIQMGGEDHQD